MSNTSERRQITVNIHLGKRQRHWAVLARSDDGRVRRDNLISRGVLHAVPDAATVDDVLALVVRAIEEILEPPQTRP